MSNTRARTAPKVSTQSEKKRKAALNEGIRITIGDPPRIYQVIHSDLSEDNIPEIREATGRSWMGIQRLMATDPDVDVLSDFIWVARYLSGEKDLKRSDVRTQYVDLIDGFEIQIADKENPITTAPGEDGEETPEA